MNVVERNLVYNELGRIRKEWRSEECELVDDVDFFWDLLNDARGIMGNQLGKEAVDMWDDDSYELEPKTVAGYMSDIGSIADFMKRCVEGKAPETVAFDRMAIGMLERLENFLDGRLGTMGDDDDEEEDTKE